MKRFKKILICFVGCFLFVFALASCSNVNKGYADKINDSYKNGNTLKYESVKKDLGDECIDITKDQTGLLIAVNGLTAANYKEKLENAKTEDKFEFISVTVVQGNCTYAYFQTGTAGEIKSAINNGSK